MNRHHFLVCFLFITFSLFSEDDFEASETFECSEGIGLIDLKGMPSALVGGCVNAITGNLNETVTDMVIAGSNPTVFSRSHNSGSNIVNNLCDAWSTNHGGVVFTSTYQNRRQATWIQGGATCQFVGTTDHSHFNFAKSQLKYGVTNCYSGGISAKTNLKNLNFRNKKKSSHVYIDVNCSEKYTYSSFDKTHLLDKSDYLLKSHRLPNRCLYEYSFDKHMRLENVFAKGQKGRILGSLEYEYPKKFEKNPGVILNSSDGRSIHYKFERMRSDVRQYFLKEVIADHLPHQRYEYSYDGHSSPQRLIRCLLPDGRYKAIDYYNRGKNYVMGQEINISDKNDGRWGAIAAISAPLGTDETPVRMYSFIYHLKKNKEAAKLLGGSTEVYDANQNKTIYTYCNEHRLNRIENILPDGSIYRVENIEWGKKDTPDYTNLLKRSISNKKSEVFSREYIYDKRGNVVEEVIKCGSDNYSKKYTYNEDDQLVTEDDGIKRIKYSFIPGSDLLTTKWIISEGRIKERYYFEYDDNGALTKEIVDDGDREDISDLHGVTAKFIKYITPTNTMPIGLPEVIDEKVFDPTSKQELLVKRTINIYSKCGYLIKQRHFDQNLSFLFDLEWEYDIKGNLILEKDAVGRVKEYRYDENNNCIFHQGPDKRVHQEFVYDFSNRLIREEKIHENGDRFTQTYSYDLCSNKVASTDCFGHTTHYVYDSLNRLVETVHPAIIRQDDTVLIPVEKLKYDVLNNIISIMDGNGNETKMVYSFHSKPISTEYPDGALEQYIYRPDGALLKSIKPNGAYVEYSYDYKNRKISERHYASNGDLRSEQKWNYSAFHLLNETDPKGIVTYYSYDARGRLCKKVKEEEESLYFYDTRGRLIETWDKYAEGKYRIMTCVYDDLDEVIEETVKDHSSKVLSRKIYEYDVNGNRTKTSVVTSNSIVTKQIEFDANNLPEKIIEPSGDITYIFRNFSHVDVKGQAVLYEETVDPMGTISAKTFDPHGKVSLEEVKSSYGELLRRSLYSFDACGKLIHRYDDHIVHGFTEKTILTSFEYDSRGHEVSIIEAANTDQQKITRRKYDKMGQVILLTKADGVKINYDYDYSGRLIDVSDDFGQIHYHYTYDLNGNIVEVFDFIKQTSTLRTYDSNNRLMEEILDNGLKMGYRYDALGRITKKIFPNQTSGDYVYDAINIKTISRKNVTVAYDYDLSGRLSQVSFPNNLGQMEYGYDSALRIIGIQTPYFSQKMSLDGYDPCGRLRKYTHADSLGTVERYFGYDPLNQVISEEGDFNHNYRYDSRFNRIEKNEAVYTSNDLNQLLSQGGASYDYDRNGNRTALTKACETFRCAYDSLDRLISVTDNQTQTTFQYDAFNRRMQKSVSPLSNGVIQPRFAEKYIYEGDEEIGSVDLQGQIKELKILGPGPLKSASFIEIASELFIPIHNHRGDVVALVQTNTGEVTATYRYSAFGEEKTFGVMVKNPWRFSGKRVDAETGWNFIGHRYYDSEVGKWITPDPLWFEDGPNLYAYVLNSPILFVDPTGLYHAGFVNNFECVRGPDFNSFDAIADGCVNTVRHLQGKEPVYNRSRVYTVPGKVYNNVTFTFTNGINNTFEEAKASAEIISKMAGGAQVILIYNASHGWALDGVESSLNYCGVRTTPAILLQEELDSASKRMGENGNILHIGHSQGCILSKLAFRGVDQSVQGQVSALLVAPAEFFNDNTCKSIAHIGSAGDLVSRLDVVGRALCTTYTEYERHPSEVGGLIDHRFASQTFYQPLENNIRDQMYNCGCFR